MAISRTSLGRFLKQAKSALKAAIEKKQNVTLVIGNESADLDSITSSIIYAYLRSTTTSPRQTYLHIPILNIPKADINLRPELLSLLPHANLTADHLITLDDLPALSEIKSSLPPDSTRWFLVDHNALQGHLGKVYSSRVVGCIDHHADEDKVPKDTGSEPRIVTTSGSCTSLIINHCRSAWEGAHASDHTTTEDSSTPTALYDAEVAKFALASILIDTLNLQDEHKTTKHDEEAVHYLEAKIKQNNKSANSEFNRTTFFEGLNEAKKDLSKLTLEEILRKDYKQWTEGELNLGTSAVVQPISFLLSKATSPSSNNNKGTQDFTPLLNAAKSFAEKKTLCIFSIMTAFETPSQAFARELAVLAVDARGFDACKKFSDEQGEKLKLEVCDEREEDGEHWFRIWRQGNVACSRKQVAPLLRQAMSG